MSIRRAPRPERNYLKLRNDVIDDPRLSLKALAILVKILRRPDHWRTDREMLAHKCKEGVTTVRTALTELRKAGYLVQTKYQDERGRWVTESIVYDTPPDGSLEAQENDPTGGGKTDGGKSTAGATRENVPKNKKTQFRPAAEKPTAESPPVKDLELEREKQLREIGENSPPDTTPSDPADGCGAASRAGIHRDDVEIICQHLADWVVRNGSLKPTITKKWRDAARLMIDNDKRELTKIMALIDWCQQNGWYRSKVRDMAKFRQQYDAMRLDALAEWEKSKREPFQRPSDLVDIGNGVKVSRRNAEALQMSAEYHAAAELAAPRQPDPEDELWAQIEASRKAQQLAATQKAERELRAIGGAL